MEAQDTADIINEEVPNKPDAQGSFRRRAAVSISAFALLLAVTSLGGANSAKDMMNSNIEASNLWAFYQAKNIRQTEFSLAKDALELQLMTVVDPAQRPALQAQISKYAATIERYESEPSTREGKKELAVRAASAETKRDYAIRQDPYFDFAGALLQIAIVLCSVAILSISRALYWLSVGLAVLGTGLMINGFTLAVSLPLFG